MKRIIFTLTALIMLCGYAAHAEDNVRVYLNNTQLSFDVQPIIRDDRTLVPLRVIFEALGADVEYDDTEEKVTAQKDDIGISLVIGSRELIRNGETVTLDVAAIIVDDRTLVPLRAVSEAFGCDVEWDEETQSVYIYFVQAPEISFDDDADGVKAALHFKLRYMFEQHTLPQLVAAQEKRYKSDMIDSPEDIVADIDDVAWTGSMYSTVLDHLLNSGKKIDMNNRDEIYEAVSEAADKYELHAYLNYSAETLRRGDKYILLMHMADINKEGIGTFAAIVYDEEKDRLDYYILESSFGGVYMLCGTDGNGTHYNYGVCRNTREAFLTAIENMD